MDLLVLVLYNFAAVGIALTGLWLQSRRPRLGIALLFVAFALLINLFVGGALLFVPVIVAIYGVIFGLPALGIWYLVRRIRRRA